VINLDDFAVDDPSPKNGRATSPPLPRPQAGERYFGQAPMGWVERACALPGRAWHLACALWFEATCEGKVAEVQLSFSARRRFGLHNRMTFYKAIRTLEGAKLIRVKVTSGQRHWFTILPVPQRKKKRR
jgi:hypothetical protein